MLKAWLKSVETHQAAVADALGVSRGYFSDLVNGNKKPSLEMALRIQLMTGGVIGLQEWFSKEELIALAVLPIASACPQTIPKPIAAGAA